MERLSVLQRVTRSDIRIDPFPHIVIENCLPTTLYSQLACTYPDDETILRLGDARGATIRPNSRHDVGAHSILENPQLVAPVWQEFISYHVSNSFFQKFVALMGTEILLTYPWLESRLGRPLKDLITGTRYDPKQKWQIALDCHVGINTPSKRETSVRRVHTDAPDELFAMLLYFRREDDTSTGGALEIFRWKKSTPRLFVGSEVDERDVERVTTIPYEPNMLVAFINSDRSLHAVSKRSPSVVSRRLVNIMGRVPDSVPEGLFVKRQKKDLVSLGRRALQRYKIVMNKF